MTTNHTRVLSGRQNVCRRLPSTLMAIVLVAPLAARAAADTGSEPVSTSRLTGIALSQARRVTDQKVAGDINQQLEQVAEKAGARLHASETLIWVEGYQPAQAPQRIQSVTHALQKAGYAYEKLGEAPIDGGKVTLFGVRNEQKGEALVGFWLAGDDFLMLRWGQLQTAGQPSRPEVLPSTEPAAAPAVTPVAATPSFGGMPRLQAEPGVATGWVADGRGRPIPGAIVTVYSMSNIGKHVFATVRTNAQGVYRATLSMPFVYFLTAHAPVEFDDSRFKMECNPVGSVEAQNGQKGIVQNFSLKLAGLRNGPDVDPTRTADYLGGAVLVVYSPDFNSGPLPNDSVVTFTLTPKGPLADGTPGRTLVYRRTLKALRNDTLNGLPLERTRALHDIPLGVYRVTATVEVPGGGTRPMTLQAGGEQGSERFQGQTVEIHFQSNGSFQSKGSVKDISEPRLMVQ